jgi:hypothetical protein
MLEAMARAGTLDAGTILPVRLNTPLSSKDSQNGDTFTATVRDDIDVQYNLPPGTRVEGVVRTARPQHNDRPGALDLDFRRLILPNGQNYSIQGALIGLDNKSVHKTPDGRLVATPGHKNDRLAYLGYGAGAGLVIGALTRHTFEDTVLGGGLGYLFGSLQKNHPQARDVNLKAGTEIGVRLDEPLTFASYSGDRDRKRLGDGEAGYHITEGNRYHREHSDGGPGIGVLIGDRNIDFDSNAQPFTGREGTILAPARPVLDALHVQYRYDADTNVIRTTGDTGRVRLAVGSRIAVMGDGRRVRLDAPAQQINGTLYVPIRFFELASGRPVHYDAGSRTVVIDRGDAADVAPENGE